MRKFKFICPGYFYSLLGVVVVILAACGGVDDSPNSSTDSSSSQTTGELSSDSQISSSQGDGSSSSQGYVVSSSSENTACKLIGCCNGETYDHSKDFCFEDKLYPMCNSKPYDPYKQGCSGDKLYPKCNREPYDETKNFCVEDQLYPLCNGESYDPYELGCFENKLYPKCSRESTRGTCVHNSLLRCRQEGKGENYIRDPLPGMKCQENGAITGTIKDYRRDEYGNMNLEKEYKVVQIGNQVWMAENLNYIPNATNLPKANSICYGDISANCNTYGRLYDWATAMNLQSECNLTSDNCPPSHPGLWGGLCPNGFAFPRSEDWQALVNYAGGDSIAGSRLKSKTGWSNNGNGTDNYNFSALPGGWAYYWGKESRDLGESSYWWVETQTGYEADYWSIISSDTEVRNHFWPKDMDMAYVRCLHY